MIAAAIFFAVAAAIWHSMASSVAGRAGSVALALALVGLLTFNMRNHLLDVRHAKGQTIANEVFQKWNSFSRIGITHNPSDEHPDLIVIDADAENRAVARLAFDIGDGLAFRTPDCFIGAQGVFGVIDNFQPQVIMGV